jgi:DNA-binding NarL/FixJ family response regulator
MGRCHHERVPCSVLVVDDDSDFRHLATRVLREWGHVVVGEAGTVADALECAAKVRPQAALVDVGLPDGDGFALAERLAAPPWGVRVVLISTDGDSAAVRAARHAGARGFLGKDQLSSQELRQLLEDE